MAKEKVLQLAERVTFGKDTFAELTVTRKLEIPPWSRVAYHFRWQGQRRRGHGLCHAD